VTKFSHLGFNKIACMNALHSEGKVIDR